MPRRTLTALAVTALAAGATLAVPAAAHAGQSMPTTPVVAAHQFYSTLLSAHGYVDSFSGRGLNYLPLINWALSNTNMDPNAPTLVDRKSLVDKNHNKYDDDGQITFRLSYNSACLNVKTGTVSDHACGTKKPVNKTPLQRAAKTVDAEIRWSVKVTNRVEEYAPISLWSYDDLRDIAAADVVDGVKVTMTDKNRDGLEDDGRIEFAKNGNKVCLNLPRVTKTKSTITFGKCATSKRGLPDDAKKVKAARAVGDIKSAIKEAAVAQETFITDNPQSVGLAFVATNRSPFEVDDFAVRPAPGVTITATVKNTVGYCIKGTSVNAPGKTIWYDPILGGIQDGNARPKGGAC